MSYVIRGVLDEGSDFGLLGGGLVIGNEHLTRDFGAKNDAFVFLRYAEGANPATTRAAIDRTLAASFPDAQTRDREEVKEQQAGQINQLLYLIYALLALSVIVSLFGIVNTLALSIFERTRELGLLRAVGMSRRQVKRIVRLEAVITSLIGALLGLVLGRGLRAGDQPAARGGGIQAHVPGRDARSCSSRAPLWRACSRRCGRPAERPGWTYCGPSRTSEVTICRCKHDGQLFGAARGSPRAASLRASR